MHHLVALVTVMSALAAQQPRLQFDGTGEIGSVLTMALTSGRPNAAVLVVLSPSTGSAQVGGFATDCFALNPGITLVTPVLDQLGGSLLPLPIPAVASLVGVYFAGQGFELTPNLPATNCASFMLVSQFGENAIVETFDDPGAHDPSTGAGQWATAVAGAVLPGRLGGRGVLGAFDPTLGSPSGGDTYVFDTDSFTFPASSTLLGEAVTVTDGVFEFTRFVIPVGITVRFEGSKPARILATGAVRIDGILDVSAPAMVRAEGSTSIHDGQLGGIGGPGAGRGGDGGATPAAGTDVDGAPGEDLGVSVGPLAPLVEGTGGRGSPANPPGAEPTRVVYAFFTFFSNQISAGGGGGGHAEPGQPGEARAARAPGFGVGPPGAGGAALARPTAGSSRELFLAGGSGGGGAGAHPYDSIHGQPVVWARGSGGGGGGGALSIAAGGDIRIGSTGAIHADGGAAADRTHEHGLLLAPGGGGSGGSVLFQAGATFENLGSVTAVGGAGGETADRRVTPGSAVTGGDGSAGVIRVESERTPILGSTMPEPSTGSIGDTDAWSTVASMWLELPVAADPARLSYELYTVQDARPVAYSSRVGFGSGEVQVGATPIVLRTRFGEIDAAGGLVAGSAGPWSVGAAPAVAGANAIQFLLQFDRGLAGGADLRVESIRLTF